jgi:UDP-N-acetylglucosamine--N-acetylmuramyl-(pentapeptide) pyrophosphoryl-undecaprenol N-acetylglucosamine transferase
LKSLEKAPQVVHLAGPGRADDVKKLYEGATFPYLVLDACYDMARLYPAADLVVCRSGGSTVSELAVFGKYAVLVPYPFAADGHQDDNAAWLASAGGAKIIKDRDFSPGVLADFLKGWLADPGRYAALGEASRAIGTPRAAEKVLDMILNIATLKPRKV